MGEGVSGEEVSGAIPEGVFGMYSIPHSIRTADEHRFFQQTEVYGVMLSVPVHHIAWEDYSDAISMINEPYKYLSPGEKYSKSHTESHMQTLKTCGYFKAYSDKSTTKMK